MLLPGSQNVFLNFTKNLVLLIAYIKGDHNLFYDFLLNCPFKRRQQHSKQVINSPEKHTPAESDSPEEHTPAE